MGILSKSYILQYALLYVLPWKDVYQQKGKCEIWSLLANEIELEWWVYIASFNNLLPNIKINKINIKKNPSLHVFKAF